VNLYRVVLADDHAPFRQVVKMVLSEKPGIEVIGEADDGFQLLSLLDRLSPNMVILDISMPNIGGIEATRQIKKSNPDIKVLILTMHRDREYLDQALSANAEGYLLKEEDITNELFQPSKSFGKGGVFVSPLLRVKGSFLG
jgi:two-component system response regulator NreC